MRILVTFAVEAEFAPWRKLRSFTQTTNGLITLYVTYVGGAELSVLLTGVGMKAAWVETTKRIWDSDTDICISSGLAGALKPDYRPGEVLVARSVRDAASGNVTQSSDDLVARAVAAGARPVQLFCTVNHVVLQASEKKKLGETADAVEMESAGVLAEAAAFGAKIGAIRGISDAVDDDLPLDFNRTTTVDGQVSIARVLGQVARHPGALPALIRFGQQSRMAAERLCVFLDRYVENLAVHADAGMIGAVTR